MSFDYSTAFSRNIGWVTSQEQAILRTKKIAIAGLGGVGGSHLLTQSRLGIGGFHIADFDSFELPNFNRQAGASMSSIGRSKTEVVAALAKDINPELYLSLFPQGVTHENMDEFLTGIDLYIDGLDFFAVEIRRAIFAACAERGIPAVTAAPLGMGTALLNFLPGKMSFEEYFKLDGLPEEEQLLRFLLGLSPSMMQGNYLVDPSTVDIAGHRGPSTPMACELCAGFAATQALKILLGRGKIYAAPWGLHFDAYRNRLKKTWRPGGSNNPLQKIALKIAKQRFKNTPKITNQKETEQVHGKMAQILNLARWAPSGDNTQPWRFEIPGERHIVVHGYDTRDSCVYDLQGHASQISVGTLLENISIAASEHGLRTNIQHRSESPETAPVFDVLFDEDTEMIVDPLAPYIPLRSVQRRKMSTRTLSEREKLSLENCLPEGYRIGWFEGRKNRFTMACLVFKNAGIRLTMPEAFEVHSKVIQWDARFSEDRIPDQAVGAGSATLKLMRWAMKSWRRISFLNRYLAGSWGPRIELDFIPALACAGHFVIIADKRPETINEFIAAGRAIQRFWLTASQLGLYLQPEMTPLIFHEYTLDNIKFSETPGMDVRAASVSKQLENILGKEDSKQAVFMGRIGSSSAPLSRSVRLPLEQLMK